MTEAAPVRNEARTLPVTEAAPARNDPHTVSVIEAAPAQNEPHTESLASAPASTLASASTSTSAPVAPLLAHVSLEVRYGHRVALVGANGSGKTTLLRLIAGELEPTAGRVVLSPGACVGTMAQEHETLDPERTVLETVLRERPMSEQDARNFLPAFLFYGDSVFKRVRECSLGERSRLQLATLVLRGCNLLLLDEPINHLDVDSREHFEAALDAFEGTVIVVAHDRAFVESFARHTYAVKDGRVSAV